MSKEIIENIKKTRLARKAQIDSGLTDEIKALQKDIVANSFSNTFDLEKHRSLINRLKRLKDQYKSIGQLQVDMETP